MGREYWATYAVNDHLQPRAFVADVLLHDRLVIPVPPPGDVDERARWIKEGWQPDRLEELLGILGEDLVRRIPWEPWQRERWKQVHARWREASHDNGQLAGAFQATRTALTQGLPAHVEAAESAAVYRSLEELERDVGLREAGGSRLPGGAVTAVLGREFLMPEDPGMSDEELLAEAADLARKPDFRNKRSAYHEWRRDFLTREGTTDRESVERAVARMSELVAAEVGALRRGRVDLGVRYGFAISGCALSVAAAPAAPLALAGAFLSLGAFVADRIIAAAEEKKPSAAAVFHSARKHFGWQ